MATTFIERIRQRVREFARAKGGNVVMTFTLATIPILGFVGASVDYSRGNSAKAAMQNAVDATALMLSKTVATDTQAQINQQATNYFNAIFNRPEVTNIALRRLTRRPTAPSLS